MVVSIIEEELTTNRTWTDTSVGQGMGSYQMRKGSNVWVDFEQDLQESLDSSCP